MLRCYVGALCNPHLRQDRGLNLTRAVADPLLDRSGRPAPWAHRVSRAPAGFVQRQGEVLPGRLDVVVVVEHDLDRGFGGAGLDLHRAGGASREIVRVGVGGAGVAVRAQRIRDGDRCGGRYGQQKRQHRLVAFRGGDPGRGQLDHRRGGYRHTEDLLRRLAAGISRSHGHPYGASRHRRDGDDSPGHRNRRDRPVRGSGTERERLALRVGEVCGNIHLGRPALRQEKVRDVANRLWGPVRLGSHSIPACGRQASHDKQAERGNNGERRPDPEPLEDWRYHRHCLDL